jgi:D-alanine transaminase
MVYLQLTRGVAPRNHVIPPNMTPTLVMTFKGLPTVPEEKRRQGLKVTTTPEIRWANCYVKAITLLPNILAKNEAIRRGFDDAVFIAAGSQVRECTSSNIFAVRDGRVMYPPRNESVLHGITQGFITECAIGIDIPICEQPITLEALQTADEVFMSSTLQEVMPITSIDNRPVANGQPGPITKKLSDEFRRRSRRG